MQGRCGYSTALDIEVDPCQRIGNLKCVFITAGPIIYLKCVCVFITAVPITKLFAGGGGGGEWRTCATRDYEPRPV